MGKCALVAVLVFAVCASTQAADSIEEILRSVVAGTVCLLAGPAKAMIQRQFLFGLGSYTAPGEGNTGVLRRHSLASDIVSYPTMSFVYVGFENGDFEGWTQKGMYEIPDEYQGNTDLNAHLFFIVDPNLPEVECGEAFFVDGKCKEQKVFYADLDFDPILPFFLTWPGEYDPTERPWYQAGAASQIGVWGEPYLGTAPETTSLSIGASVPLFDTNAKLLGVTNGVVRLNTLEIFLIGEAALYTEGTVIYIMDSSKEQNLIASSIEGLAAESYALGQATSAQSSTNTVIAMSAASIANEEDPSQLFVAGGPDGKVLIQTATIDEIGSLPFADGLSWVFVVVQSVVCGAGEEETKRTETHVGCKKKKHARGSNRVSQDHRSILAKQDSINSTLFLKDI